MDFINVKMEKVFPVFFGILGAMLCCTMISAKIPGPFAFFSPQPAEQTEDEASKEGPILFYTELPVEKYDLIRELYNTEENRSRVIDFFARICGSRDIAKTILLYADVNNIPPALAFALAWEESRFNVRAVNAHNRDGSTDRGLFQLNSQSFPGIEPPAFFDPDVSARYGMSHLRYCLDSGGTEIAALAMYNAGTGRVRSTGAPKSTLDYIHRILTNKQRIESLFREDVGNKE